MTNKGKKPRLVAENRYPKTGAAKKSAKKKTRDKTQNDAHREKAWKPIYTIYFWAHSFCCHGFVAYFLAWRLGHRHYAGHWHWLLHARSKAL